MALFPVPQKKLIYDPAIVGVADLFIAETEADATAAIASGFPAICFPDKIRTDDNYSILLDLCKKSKRVFIINSSNDSARFGEIWIRFAKEGMVFFIVSLHDEATASYTPLAAYLKTHSVEDFKVLVEQAGSIMEIFMSNLAKTFTQVCFDVWEALPLILKLDRATARHYLVALNEQFKTLCKVIEVMIAVRKRSQAASGKAEVTPPKQRRPILRYKS